MNVQKEKLWDYFILTARFLLAWTFARYGYSKLVGGQFGLSEVEMLSPLKDLSLFQISWYLFEHEPFNSFVGISQIICAVLLFINRTTIIGAFFFLPIVTTILIIDLTFMPSSLAEAFAWRLGFYIILDFLILWYHKEKLIIIWNAVWNNVNTRFNFPIWAYLLLPVSAILLEVLGFIPKTIIQFITNPSQTIEGFKMIPDLIKEVMKNING